MDTYQKAHVVVSTELLKVNFFEASISISILRMEM